MRSIENKLTLMVITLDSYSNLINPLYLFPLNTSLHFDRTSSWTFSVALPIGKWLSIAAWNLRLASFFKSSGKSDSTSEMKEN